jgi:hypothetical protein
VKIRQQIRSVAKDVGNGFAAHVPATLESTPKDDLDYDLRMTVDFVAGKLVCTSLQANSREGGVPVTGEGLRAIPVARLVQQVISKVLLEVEPAKGGGAQFHSFRWPPEDFAADGPTDEALGHVARVYRWAHAVGEPPVRTLEQLGLPRGTANRWVTLARQRGLLGKAKPRAAGEVEGF